MATDLSGNIATTAQEPAAASSEAGSVTQQPLGALIAADQYLAAKAAVKNRRRGLRLSGFTLAGPLGTRADSSNRSGA